MIRVTNQNVKRSTNLNCVRKILFTRNIMVVDFDTKNFKRRCIPTIILDDIYYVQE